MAKTLGFILPLVFFAVYSTMVVNGAPSYGGPTNVIAFGDGAAVDCDTVCGEDADEFFDCFTNSELFCISSCYFRGFDWFHFREKSGEPEDITDPSGICSCGGGPGGSVMTTSAPKSA